MIINPYSQATKTVIRQQNSENLSQNTQKQLICRRKCDKLQQRSFMRLLKFSVSNFRSFNAEQTIEWNQNSNVSAIFGPNGSGKTNFFQAMTFFRDFIRLSTKYDGQKLNIDTFALSNQPTRDTSFSAQVDTGTYVYEYSFSIANRKISKEHLKRRKQNEKSFTTVYTRASISTCRYSHSGFTPELLSQTRDDALLLTKAWENNNKDAIAFFAWLDHFHAIAGAQPTEATSKRVMEQPDFKAKVLNFLRGADLYIQDILVSPVNLPEQFVEALPFVPEFKKAINRKGYGVLTTHFIYDKDSGAVVGARPLDLVSQESNGTRRMYELALPVIDSLEKGNILCIDEFEIFLHPQECSYIINLFRDQNINNQNAQLIILTHATQIMNQLDRKDIHIFGKNSKEETIIGGVPSSIRQDDRLIEKKYLRGLFGGIPNIGGGE